MGEVEKSSFYCFARQREPQWANALKAVWPTLEGVVRSLTVFKEQSVISLWTVLELACIKVKLQESSIFWFQPVKGLCSGGQQFSSGGGLLPVKTA